MHSYLSEKNFLYLYLYKMFYRGSTAPVHIFTGTGLVVMGASITSVIFFYALTILTLGLMSPVGVFVMNHYSVKIAAMSSVMFRFLFFVCLLLVERGQHDLLWLGAFFYGCSYGIFPMKDIMEAIYIKGNAHRGKQMTMAMVLAGIMVSITVALSGYFLSIYGFIALIAISLFLQSCSIVVLLKMKGEPLCIENYKISDGYSVAIKERPLKGIYPMVWAQQMVFTVSIVMLPLYMFHVIGDMRVFAFVAASAALLEVFVTLVFGRFIDKSVTGGAQRQGALMTVISAVILTLFVKTPLTALLADSFNKMTMNMLVVSTNTSIHKLLRSKDKGHLLLYSAVWQMTYSFFEVFSLLGLALVYHYFGLTVFTVSFAMLAFGGFFNYYNFSENKEKQRKMLLDGA
ncbi:MAG: hypothetical protein ACI9TY_001132 [Alphaproteobacteria bacterium]|jgi:hypothetical protein